MIGRTVNRRLNLGANHCYFFHQGDWYHNLRSFPGVLVDNHGYVKFETIEDYQSNPHLQHGSRLHIRNGISSIPEYVSFNEEQLFVLSQITRNDIQSLADNIQTERRPRNVDTIVRSQTHVKRVKRLHNHTCQICSLQLRIGPNSFYSEVHHIKPLGNPHNGPDILSNMLCVCPNCHKILDYGFVPIDSGTLIQIKGHSIDMQFVAYHNARV